MSLRWVVHLTVQCGLLSSRHQQILWVVPSKSQASTASYSSVCYVIFSTSANPVSSTWWVSGENCISQSSVFVIFTTPTKVFTAAELCLPFTKILQDFWLILAKKNVLYEKYLDEEGSIEMCFNFLFFCSNIFRLFLFLLINEYLPLILSGETFGVQLGLSFVILYADVECLL